MDASVIEPFWWNTIFILLSLDGVFPFFEEMGLQLGDKEGFVRMLRRLIAQSREIYGRGRMPDIEFANNVLKEIEANFGKGALQHFYKWATTVFAEDYPVLAQWSAWRDVIPHHPAQLPEWLPPERWEAIAQFHEAHDVSDIEQKVKALRSKPLTLWDAEIYSIYSYSNVEDPMFEDDFNDPYSDILSTVKMNRFQVAWPKLWSHFSHEEKNLFWEYGKRERKEEGLDKYDAGGIPHPDELHRQI